MSRRRGGPMTWAILWLKSADFKWRNLPDIHGFLPALMSQLTVHTREQFQSPTTCRVSSQNRIAGSEIVCS
jgi:hypothetical protein